jgi:hypothetical protein
VLWQHYVFRRGPEVNDMWESAFGRRPARLLYIAGRGFDYREQAVMRSFVASCKEAAQSIQKAELLLVGFEGYQLTEELEQQTAENAAALKKQFSELGPTTSLDIGFSAAGEDDISANNALRMGTAEVLKKITDQTDIILDVSSLPRVVYLALMTGILSKLIPDKTASNALSSSNINFQVLVAEDAALDAQILSEDPSNDLVLIPGFSSALHAESVQDWPLVWFPILGEKRMNQLQKVMESEIPIYAEICPVVPHPSRDLRRADRLLVEYKLPLFDTRATPTGNILYAHESHPFEAYRQLLGAMERYRESMSIIGGCRLVVTPLGSKLITIGAGLACFEMRPSTMGEQFVVAIPYAHPTRYVASTTSLRDSKPDICALVLTGEAYAYEAS